MKDNFFLIENKNQPRPLLLWSGFFIIFVIIDIFILYEKDN